jgi:hypothetical protein
MTDRVYEILDRIESIKNKFGLNKKAETQQVSVDSNTKFQIITEDNSTDPVSDTVIPKLQETQTIRPDVSSIINTIVTPTTKTNDSLSLLSDVNSKLMQSAVEIYKKTDTSKNEIQNQIDIKK